jgi:hypothetical protein
LLREATVLRLLEAVLLSLEVVLLLEETVG